MPDHLIHLRRAWTAEGEGPARVDLPTTWGPGPIPTRLLRTFQGPPLDTEAQSLWLRFDSVQGVRSASLNGLDLGAIPEGRRSWEVAVTTWASRGNRLELGIEPAETPREEVWGRISLVIRS